MVSFRHKATRVKRYINDDIWRIDLEELSKARARAIKYLKIVMITVKTFANQKIGFQATALSFFSTMAVVPFVAIIFVVTGGLGLADKLKTFLYSYFSNSQGIVDMLLNFAGNIIETAHSSVMGLISALLFVWVVIQLLMSVEKVFNNVWQVEKSRNIFKRFSYYLAMLIVVPLMVMVFFAGYFIYSNALDYIGLDWKTFTFVKTFLSWSAFGAVVVLTFSLMYKYIPNAFVKYSNALRASVFSGVAFTVMQYVFLETQSFVTRLNAVYGAFAAIPLFMTWLNIGWFIILIGAQLSYAFQHVDEYNVNE